MKLMEELKMPNPNDFDNRQDFLEECIPTVMGENDGDREAAIGQCEGMWDNRDKGKNSAGDMVVIDESIFKKEKPCHGGDSR